MLDKRKFRILAIDGGGIRGVIPLQFIRHIEDITKTEIHNSFDLIAGTSTGGILSSALTFQDKENIIANKRKYSIDELEAIYKDKGKIIFPICSNLLQRTKNNVLKWIKPQFDPKYLNSVLEDYFGQNRITSCLKPIYIASYDIHRNRPMVFTFREASLFPEKNSTLIEISRATSAAPTYFPTYNFSYASERVSCIDGGIYMNNPSLGALVEVLGNSDYKHYRINDESLKLDEISILSLGTGFSHNLIDSNKAENWGRIKWIKPVIELSTNGPVKVTHLQLETIFKSFGLDNNYLRLDIHIDKKYSEMSDSRDETLTYLINKAREEIKSNETLTLKIENFLRVAGII